MTPAWLVENLLSWVAQASIVALVGALLPLCFEYGTRGPSWRTRTWWSWRA